MARLFSHEGNKFQAFWTEKYLGQDTYSHELKKAMDNDEEWSKENMIVQMGNYQTNHDSNNLVTNVEDGYPWHVYIWFIDEPQTCAEYLEFLSKV